MAQGAAQMEVGQPYAKMEANLKKREMQAEIERLKREVALLETRIALLEAGAVRPFITPPYPPPDFWRARDNAPKPRWIWEGSTTVPDCTCGTTAVCLIHSPLVA